MPQPSTGDGFLTRNDQQFHWFNEGYGSFDDFLAALSSRKRKAIRRERRDALATASRIDWVTGSDLTEAHWDAFFAFYMDTGSRKWGRPYLNRRFFSLLGERMADRVLLVMAKRNGALHRRRAQPDRRPPASTAATGAASRTSRSCISRSATTRRSTFAIDARASNGWRPARRASTSSPAAIAR